MDGEDQIHIALEPGVTFVYEGEFDGWREERLELTVLDVWEGGVTWSFRYYSHRGQLEAAGLDTQTALDMCKSVAPWKIPEGRYDDSCDFFISPTQFRELISNKRTFFRDDRYTKSAPVRLEKPNATKWVITFDGRDVELDAIEAVTTRREVLVILNDADTPLILNSTQGDFHLTEINHKKRH